MYDPQFRIDLARDRALQLRLDWPATPARRRARVALGRWLIRTGNRLVPEPRLSLRA